MRVRLPRLKSRTVILLAGIGLVAGGAVCLYLSEAVAAAQSWAQGTLQAFGVGFVVGGIVDVTAISLLNPVISGAGKQLASRNREAEQLLDQYGSLLHAVDGMADIASFVRDHGDAIDPLLRGRLIGLQQRLAEHYVQQLRREAIEDFEQELSQPDATD